MKWIQNIIMGCLISLSASYLSITIITLSGGNHKLWTGDELLEQVLLTLVLGVVIGAAMMLFEQDTWPLQWILLLHLFIVIVAVFSVGAVGGWYDWTNIHSVLFLLAEIAVIYLIVWFIMLVLRHNEIKKINEILKKKTGE